MPWVKVYTEILDDPKILRLSLSAKWRFIQFIALAGEADASGAIINGGMALTLADLSMRLRDSAKKVQADINELADIGLISLQDGVFFVENFEKRQGRPQSERQKMWREAQNARRIRESKTAPEPKTSTPDPVVIADTENVINDSSMTPRPRLRVRVDKDKEKSTEIGAPAKKPVGETGANAQPPKKVSTKNGPDPRSGHPAIAAIREITGRFPNRVLYDQLIGALKESPDMDLARECYKSWLARGYNPNAVTAFTDWYAQGGPPAPPGKRMDAATARNDGIAVYKGEAAAAAFEAEERAKNPDYDKIPF